VINIQRGKLKIDTYRQTDKEKQRHKKVKGKDKHVDLKTGKTKTDRDIGRQR
jgi:hypothetical protein